MNVVIVMYSERVLFCSEELFNGKDIAVGEYLRIVTFRQDANQQVISGLLVHSPSLFLFEGEV